MIQILTIHLVPASVSNRDLWRAVAAREGLDCTISTGDEPSAEVAVNIMSCGSTPDHLRILDLLESPQRGFPLTILCTLLHANPRLHRSADIRPIPETLGEIGDIIRSML